MTHYCEDGVKDGGIDIFDSTSKTVWQCKLPKENKLSDFNKLKKIIATEATKLKNILALPISSEGQNAYRLWFDPDFCISRYVFVLGGYQNCEADRHELIEFAISKFKAALGQPSLPTSRHKIEIELLTAKDLDQQLEEFPAVRLKWFEPEYPSGVEPLSKYLSNLTKGDDPLRRSFKAYLHSSNIPYVELSDAALRPSALLGLLDSGDCTAILLDGTGGQGKTRLALEVATFAHEQQWTVLTVDAESLESTLVDKIVKLCVENKTLLIIDYAEKANKLPQSLDRIKSLNENSANMRIFLTCRQQFSEDIFDILHDRLDDQAVRRHLDSVESNRIVQGILAKPELVQYQEKCKAQPVFAAFVFMMNERGAVEPLAELSQQNDFRSWLRLHVSKLPNHHTRSYRTCSTRRISSSN